MKILRHIDNLTDSLFGTAVLVALSITGGAIFMIVGAYLGVQLFVPVLLVWVLLVIGMVVRNVLLCNPRKRRMVGGVNAVTQNANVNQHSGFYNKILYGDTRLPQWGITNQFGTWDIDD